MAITTKFDLKTTQIDAVNAFIHYDLNEVIYIKLPLGFNKKKGKQNTVLKKSPIQTIIITTIITEESHKLINRIGF